MADVTKFVGGIKYLVKHWIPYAMVTMIVAEPGIGKSAFALFALVRAVILATNWFNNMPGPNKSGDALWCDTEGSAAINVQRIKDWGLPAERIKVPFADDPLRPAELLENAENDGFSETAIRRARNELGIVKPNVRKIKDGWEWKLPSPGGRKASGKTP